MKKEGHRTSYPLLYISGFGTIFYFIFSEMLKFAFFFLKKNLMKETHGPGTHGGT